MPRITGTILAGGASSRMGRDKAFVPFAGRPLSEWVAAAVTAVVADVLVVGREGTLAGLRAVPDRTGAGPGPLGGLVTALAETGTGVLLVAVDQPLVAPATLRALIDLHSRDPGAAVVPVEDGVPQVTCAVYPQSWAEEAGGEAAAGGSIRSLLGRLPHRVVDEDEWRGWGEDGRSWLSIDTPADLAAALRLLGPDR